MHEKFTFPFCFRLHHAFSAKKLLFDFEALKFYQAAYTPEHQDEQFEHHLCHAQCTNFRIFLPLRFYVKSIFEVLETQKCRFVGLPQTPKLITRKFLEAEKS